MNRRASLIFAWCLLCLVGRSQAVYQGSTPADLPVRKFLAISLTDSIDFIRWRLTIGPQGYEVHCQYGISKPNTPGFIDPKTAQFSGTINLQGNYLQLMHGSASLSVLKINTNILHLLDQNKNFLIGNGILLVKEI